MPPILERPRIEDSASWHDDDCLVGRTPEQRWVRQERAGHLRNSAWELGRRPAKLRSGAERRHAYEPVPIEALFDKLADTWERDTAFESVVARKALHPAYQRIIGIGPPAVPLILRRLRAEPRQWYWALTAITGEDPAEGLTTADEAADAWLRWGEQRGVALE